MKHLEKFGYLIEVAKDNLIRDGNLTPVILLFKGKNGTTIVPDFKDKESKRMSIDAVKKIIKEKGFKEIVIITEIWFTSGESAEIVMKSNIRPSECALKQEAIIISYCNDKGKKEEKLIPFLKSDKEIIFLEDDGNQMGEIIGEVADWFTN